MRHLLKGLLTIFMTMAIIGNSSVSFFIFYQPRNSSGVNEISEG